MSSNSKKKAEILNGFQALRQEQRALTSKLSEVETDVNEHKMVIDTLKNVNEDRRCFRLVGGILIEQKVKDVLPGLMTNHAKLTEVIGKLNEQVIKKGQEINEYREKHNINIVGLDNPKPEEAPAAAPSEPRGNVLVS
ncbi:unnamed protein product [Callosobruchus maculatus]|uniref:Prefoldin subunit 2 n=1 Tax=Callosobruchus maculatus TaxID=64391 RepID=A0A653DU50_CALMS|nr:unnamed protein product [Callosobruchus maculatus]